MADDELDDILDSALTEFGSEFGQKEKTVAEVLKESALASEKADKDLAARTHAEETSDNLAAIVETLDTPEFQANLQSTLKHLSEGGDSPDGTNPFNGTGVGSEGLGEMDADIAKTMQALSQITAKDMPGMGLEASAMEGVGDDIMQQMMKDFENMAEKKDFGNVMDSLMKQLLSKDIMYEPVKAICEKYPEWLAENESKLPKAEYEAFGKQYQSMQRMCAVFETEPDNYERLVELMQDMQEHGQPPAEIIKDLAPGLNFSDDGVPQMANMGPGLASMLGGPPMGGGADGQCSVM